MISHYIIIIRISIYLILLSPFITLYHNNSHARLSTQIVKRVDSWFIGISKDRDIIKCYANLAPSTAISNIEQKIVRPYFSLYRTYDTTEIHFTASLGFIPKPSSSPYIRINNKEKYYLYHYQNSISAKSKGENILILNHMISNNFFSIFALDINNKYIIYKYKTNGMIKIIRELHNICSDDFITSIFDSLEIIITPTPPIK